jgi:outer membrane protein assembly factor BamB
VRGRTAGLIAAAALVAAVVVGWALGRQSSGPSSPPPAAAPAPAGSGPAAAPPPAHGAGGRLGWPVFGVDAARTSDFRAATGVTARDVAGLRRRVVRLPGTVDSSPILVRAAVIGGRRRDAFVMTTTYGRTLALSPGGRVLWTYTPPSYAGYAGSARITTATPALDPDGRYVYAAAPDGRIRKLAVADGRPVAGGGWPARATLLPEREKIAAPLALWRDDLIVATGGYIGDAPPYQGHVVVIRRATGRVTAVVNALCAGRRRLQQPSTCSSSDAAIWGRSAPVVDPATGEILVATGNAPFDGRADFGDSILALAPGAARIAGTYTPANQDQLRAQDLDLGSTAPAILSERGLVVVQGGKDGVLRVVALAGRGVGGTGGELELLRTPGGAPLFTAIAVARAGGTARAFVADASGTAAYRVSGSGATTRLVPAWSNPTAGTSPVVAGGLLYVYDPGGALNVYDPRTGERLAHLSAGAGHWSSPIVADGVVALPVGNGNDHATSGAIDLYFAPGRIS